MDGLGMSGGGNFDIGGIEAHMTLDWSQLKSGLDTSKQLLADFENRYGRITLKLSVDAQAASQQLSQFAAAVQSAPPFQLKAAFDMNALTSQFQQVNQQFTTSFAAAGQQAAQQFATALQQAVNNVQLPSPGQGGGGGGGGSGGGGGRRGLGGMAARMIGHQILYDLVQAPISHVQGELQ